MTKKLASNRVDMIGKTYNSWKVLEHSHTNGKIAYYKCECLECNQINVVDGRNVRQGASKRCVTCGLKSTKNTQTGVKKSKKSSKEIAELYLYKQKKKGANKRGKNWAVSMEEFILLIYDNCFYCDRPPYTTVNPTKGYGLHADRATECYITYNGIDRIDSNKGYEPLNMVTCCEYCNKSKLDRSTEDFLTHVQELSDNLRKKGLIK